MEPWSGGHPECWGLRWSGFSTGGVVVRLGYWTGRGW
jgi:hypothetical protein